MLLTLFNAYLLAMFDLKQQLDKVDGRLHCLSLIKAKEPENVGNINLYGQICLVINPWGFR